MDKKKSVDESWKESAAKEKAEGPTENELSGQGEPNAGAEQPEAQMPPVNFFNYVSSMAFQAIIFLGEVPNPITNKVDKNLQQAKFIIETLSMLKEKTKGNLSDDEERFLSSSVYELQMKFIELSKEESNESGA